MAIKFNYAVICEESRREDTGKLFIIGMYGSNIRVSEFPATLALALVLNISSDEVGSAALELQCMVGDERKAGAKATMNFTKTGGISLLRVPPLVLVDIKEPAEIQFQARQDGGDWQTIASIPLEGPDVSVELKGGVFD